MKNKCSSPLQELVIAVIQMPSQDLVVFLLYLDYPNLLLIFRLVVVFGDSMGILMKPEVEHLLDLVHLRNSLDLLNLSLSIQKKNNYSSPSQDLVQRKIQNHMLVLVISLHSLVQLSLLPIFKLVVVFGNSVVIVTTLEVEHLLVLDHSRNLVVLLNLLPSIQMRDNYYSLFLVLVQKNILKYMLVLVIYLHFQDYQNLYLLLRKQQEQRYSNSDPLHMHPILIIMLDLDHLKNSLVLLRVSHLTHLKDNSYSPLQVESQVKNIQNHMLVLEELKNYLVLLSQFVGLLNIQQVFIKLLETLMIREQETLLDLDHSKNSVVLLNLSHSIHLKEICYSPSLVESQVRSILNLMLVLDSLETSPQLE